MTERISGLGDLTQRFDAFLVDQYGVLLNGSGPYPYASKALAQLARRGKRNVVLSNSGKRSAENETRLVKLGFAPDCFVAVLSSGETAYAEIARRIGKSLKPGARIWVHVTDDTASPVAGLDLSPCEDPAEADLLLLAGCRPWAYSLEEYSALLRAGAEAGKPCVCSNPDMTMMVGNELKFGAGRVARMYEEMGGHVEWFGKPHPAIYVEALRLLADIDRGRILCIGDSPSHDILGGCGAGLATALVRTGIHAAESEADVMARCESLGARPDFLLPRMDF
jgi:HAD superfamily hydrolase (TIGR01459 family)